MLSDFSEAPLCGGFVRWIPKKRYEEQLGLVLSTVTPVAAMSRFREAKEHDGSETNDPIEVDFTISRNHCESARLT